MGALVSRMKDVVERAVHQAASLLKDKIESMSHNLLVAAHIGKIIGAAAVDGIRNVSWARFVSDGRILNRENVIVS